MWHQTGKPTLHLSHPGRPLSWLSFFPLYRFFSDDAARTNKGVRTAAFTIELRDKGRYGFLLPREQVINGPHLEHVEGKFNLH